MVGPESQKDRLSFVSLTRQVESGKSKGYTESEVIEAVIRAICPTLKLRSYVETMEGLTLKKLLQILKAHYKQKSATELYHELTILCQDPKESAEDFLIRALELRQQVLFTSRVMEEDVKYSHELVQTVLLRALETGIKNETICAKMRPLFKKHDVTDEELIKRVGDAMSEETERSNKLTLSSRKQAAKVNSYMYDKDGQESKATKNVQSEEKGRRDTLMMTLEAVKTDIANIKSSMAANNNQGFGNDAKQRVTRKVTRKWEMYPLLYMWFRRTLCKGTQTAIGKRTRTPSEGQEVVQDSNKSHLCGNCGKSQNSTSILRCSRYKTVCYCSKSCQSDHWKNHQSFCDAIVNMVIKDAKEGKEWLEKGQYVSHLTPAQQNNVIKLVGNRCLVKCLIEDVPVEALWDTGAQVSIASHEWVMKNFPDVK